MGEVASRFAVAAGVALACALVFDAEGKAFTGALSSPSCSSGDTGTSPRCSLVADSAAGGTNSGLDELQSVDTIDNSVYVTSQGDDAIAHFQRNPTTGVLTFVGCVTGEIASGPSGSTACAASGFSTATGANSGFDQPSDAVVSSNGEWLYATTQGDDAVLRFQRNTANGTLSYFDCISGSTAVTGCTPTASATASGAASGLDNLSGIAISKNGTSIYVTSQSDDSIARFSRNPTTGVLTYQDCISAESGTAGGACTAAPDTSATGDGTGLDTPFSPVVSDDGANVYFSTNGDASVVWLNRAANGSLTFNDCITGDLDSAPANPPTSCGTAIPSATATPEGANSGMERIQTLALSADDGSVYAGSQTDASLVQFTRNGSTGDLTFAKCLSGDAGTGAACDDVPPVTASGPNSGMYFLQSLAPSPDGKSLYAAGAGDSAITSFALDLGTGEPSWSGCVTGNASAVSMFCTAQNAAVGGIGSGTGGLRSLAVTTDGLGLVGAAQDDAAGVSVVRSPAPDTSLDTGPGALTNDSTPTFTFSADEPGATFQCRIDAGAFGACSGAGTHTTAALADGSHTFQVRARNDVPTPDSTPASTTFTVDTTPPQTTINSGPEGPVASTTVDFGFSAPGASSFACRIDGGAFSACASPKSYSGLAEGSHTFEVRATDAVGNVDASPAGRSFSVDTTGPALDLSKHPKKKLKSKSKKAKVKAKFVFATADLGATFECSADKGKDFAPCTSPFVKKYKKGKHTVTIRAVDALGNEGAEVATKFKVKPKD